MIPQTIYLIKEKNTGKYLLDNRNTNSFTLVDINDASQFTTQQFAQFYIDEFSTPNPNMQFIVEPLTTK